MRRPDTKIKVDRTEIVAAWTGSQRPFFERKNELRWYFTLRSICNIRLYRTWCLKMSANFMIYLKLNVGVHAMHVAPKKNKWTTDGRLRALIYFQLRAWIFGNTEDEMREVYCNEYRKPWNGAHKRSWWRRAAFETLYSETVRRSAVRAEAVVQNYRVFWKKLAKEAPKNCENLQSLPAEVSPLPRFFSVLKCLRKLFRVVQALQAPSEKTLLLSWNQIELFEVFRKKMMLRKAVHSASAIQSTRPVGICCSS